jgi:excisionase family DNA binding protein
VSDGKRLKFEEACAELGISEAELEQLVARGEIASVKEGDSLFIKREVLESYKSQSDEPAILLSDEEINLLEDDDIDFGIDLEEPAAAPEVAASMSVDAETDELSLDDDLPDLDIGGDVGDVLEGATDPEATVVNVGGLLEDEGTTPVEGDPSGMLEDTGDLDLEGGLGEETLLDTEVLDLGADDTDTFDLDTAEETLMDPTEEGALLRGGGARVMQMKRKKSHAVWTGLLAASALILLVPLGVLLSMVYMENATADADTYKWIGTYGKYFQTPVDWLSSLFE